jgi:hypothetical protein
MSISVFAMSSALGAPIREAGARAGCPGASRPTEGSAFAMSHAWFGGAWLGGAGTDGWMRGPAMG